MKVLLFIFLLVSLSSFQAEKLSDMVPDAKTATKIAEAIWLPVYGVDIYKEKPFRAILVEDSVWLVTGSLPKPKKVKGGVIVAVGGVAICRIRKKDGTILQVIHGK